MSACSLDPQQLAVFYAHAVSLFEASYQLRVRFSNILDGRLPEHGTDHLPGSPGKIDVMSQRLERGEALFHPTKDRKPKKQKDRLIFLKPTDRGDNGRRDERTEELDDGAVHEPAP